MATHIPAEWRQGAYLESLYQEFCAQTTGQHSAALQRLLNWLRSEPMEGKLAVLCTTPHRHWVLVRMQGRGRPLSVLGERFTDIDAAERAIFRHRVRERLGHVIRSA